MRRSTVVPLLLLVSLVAGFFTACTRDPNVRKQKYLESGNHFREDGKFPEAVIQYLNAIQLDPRFAEAHFQLGETYLKMGDRSRAFQELSRTVELVPDNFQAHVDLANILVSARNTDGSANSDYLKQALPHLEILRREEPNDPKTFESWADYYAAQNNLGEAIQEMQKGIAADPTRWESYLNLAVLQLRSNLPDQAEASFKKAAEAGPDAMTAQLALGSFYQTRNRMAEAEQQFKHAVAVDPKDPAPRAAYVRVLMAQGKKAETEDFLKQTKSDLPDNPEGYRMLGDYYFATEQIDKATAEYGSLYQDHPHDPVVKRNYIQLLILQNRLDEATKLNDEILEKNPNDVDALVYRGQILLRHNDANDAADSLQQAIKNDPNNAVAHYQLGLAFDMQRDDGRAESEWREAIRLRPDLTDAERHLATMEIRHGSFDALVSTSEQIINNQPSAADGYIFRALGEMNLQRYSEAGQDLTKARELAPDSAVTLVQTGNLALLQKQYPEALKSYQQALEKDPASTDGLQGVMNTYLAEKLPDQALAAAQSQIAKAPKNSGFYDLLGTVLFQSRKDLKGAEAAFYKSVELDSSNSDALLKLGEVQAAGGSVDQALATYQQSIKDHPQEIGFYILAGEMYASENKWDQAKDMYQKALSIQSDNPLASNNLAYIMLQQGGNVDVALAMAQTARRGMPNSSNAADTLGWAYYQKGVYHSAIEMFQEALRLSEKSGGADNATVHYHLGLAYQHTKQIQQARQELERVLKLDPNYADARKALSELRG
ncbi:MAG TPA: tetratricopeptide repeat protein [Acidobacteriaceae bacterium]|nr:tetratricopeptide repeat protein [Acidobacteriaceae bacterium]